MNARRWEKLSLSEVAALLGNGDFPWWVAGGHAIELAVGRKFRSHGDLDILILRRDQHLVREVLSGWDLHVADPPGTGELRPWNHEEFLGLPLNGLWCRRSPSTPWSFELMLDEAEGDVWFSRRDSRVHCPIDRVGCVTSDGIPYLTPEVQLFYKAKAHREKDEIDFNAVLPLLDGNQRAWLRGALNLSYPVHPWRDRLEERHE
ncbi:amino acid transporter [Streptomyces cinnamoneus]|uniref:nucleotidyltransferase domain-containing protein n=1 Tax=Streptomyces cinnamoneus TaxID=53446 RepID=UPI0033E017E3